MAPRRPRKYQNPRPIPLDREATERLLDRLYLLLGEKADQYGDRRANDADDPIGLVSSSITLRTTRGDNVSVRVILTAATGHAGFVNGGGSGTQGGRPVVIIELNGRYPWTVLADPMTRPRLATVLRHELSHAADVFASGSAPKRKGSAPTGAKIPSTAETADLRAYYNHSGEVAAYMREIYEELRPIVMKVMGAPLGREWGLGGTVSRMLNSNETWQTIDPYLTPRNRKRILSGIVRAFRDDGL
jgi:hypothetical protein